MDVVAMTDDRAKGLCDFCDADINTSGSDGHWICADCASFALAMIRGKGDPEAGDIESDPLNTREVTGCATCDFVGENMLLQRFCKITKCEWKDGEDFAPDCPLKSGPVLVRLKVK